MIVEVLVKMSGRISPEMEHWGQEVTVTFRVKGLKLPLTEENVKCQMKVKDVFKVTQKAPTGLGPVMSRLGPPPSIIEVEGIVDPVKIEVKEEPEMEVEEVVEVVGEDIDTDQEELEGAVGLGPHQEAKWANTPEPTKQGKWPKITAPDQYAKRVRTVETMQEVEETESTSADPNANGARPKDSWNKSAQKVIKLIRDGGLTPVQRHQLAITAGPSNTTPRQVNPVVTPRQLTSIKNWTEDSFQHGPKDYRTKCFSSGCSHNLYRSQMRGHCLRYHLPDYYCKELENQEVYELQKKIELRRIATCKMLRAMGYSSQQEMEIAAKVIIMQTNPEATIAGGDVAEINAYLAATGASPLRLKATILEAGLNGMLCWQAAIHLINALTQKMRSAVLPEIRALGAEDRLR